MKLVCYTSLSLNADFLLAKRAAKTAILVDGDVKVRIGHTVEMEVRGVDEPNITSPAAKVGH